MPSNEPTQLNSIFICYFMRSESLTAYNIYVRTVNCKVSVSFLHTCSMSVLCVDMFAILLIMATKYSSLLKCTYWLAYVVFYRDMSLNWSAKVQWLEIYSIRTMYTFILLTARVPEIRWIHAATFYDNLPCAWTLHAWYSIVYKMYDGITWKINPFVICCQHKRFCIPCVLVCKN